MDKIEEVDLIDLATVFMHVTRDLTWFRYVELFVISSTKAQFANWMIVVSDELAVYKLRNDSINTSDL